MPRSSADSVPRLSRLRIFDSVAAHGTMSAAAETLHVTQPAITRAVTALEQEVGTVLLQRRRDGSFLTAPGATFARRTRRFFQQLSAALSDALEEDAGSEAIRRMARKLSDVHLRTLVAISGGGSFRKAAVRLGVREPTIHRPARDLERLLRLPLYRRAAGGLELTPVGAELARRFALAVIEITTGIGELAARSAAVDPVITIGVLALAPKRLLARTTEAFARKHPRVRVVIKEASYAELVAALRHGGVDFVFGALRSPPPYPDLAERPLFSDPYSIACRRGHPLTRQAVSRQSLTTYGWVFPTRPLPRRAALEAVIAAWRLPAQVQIETDALDTIVAALVASDRLSLLPRECIDDNAGSLKALDIAVPQPIRRVGITTRLDWLPTIPQADLMQLLESAAHRGR